MEKLVLSNVTFNVNKGEFVYIIGRVGSGKSSLLKTIYADIPLKDGEINIANYNLKQIKKNEVPYLRRKLGIVFQDFQLLLDRNIYENLKFVLEATDWKHKNDINERIANVLTKVGLTDKVYNFPHQLSGGEQQRVVIARALLNFPEIVLADEPTGNLDPESSEQILTTLWEINKNGTSVLMATHNYHLIKKFPARILKIENNIINEVNNVNDIFNQLF